MQIPELPPLPSIKRLPSDPRLAAAICLLHAATHYAEAFNSGRLSARNFARKVGCRPEEVLDALLALTSHIEILGPDGEMLSPAKGLQ